MRSLMNSFWLPNLVALLLLLACPFRLSAAGNNWMSSIQGDALLSALSIPGTHDAGARFEPFPGTAKCQDLTLAEQLNAGVRFLDIRCRHVNNAFVIHHGVVYQHQNFDDVLNTVLGFLTNNPTETVIMSVKEEYDAKNNTRSFEATFDSYAAKCPDRWWLNSNVPTLDQSRGKIVLFRRFSAAHAPKGLDLSVWPDNATFTNANVRVQDDYVVASNAAKWFAITNLLAAAQTGDPHTLFVNFASGYKPGLISSIPAVAKVINPDLTSYFTTHKQGRYGIILMDFADAEKCRLIYETAFN